MTNGYDSLRLRGRCAGQVDPTRMTSQNVNKSPSMDCEDSFDPTQILRPKHHSIQQLDSVMGHLNITEHSMNVTDRNCDVSTVDSLRACDFCARNSDGDTLLMKAIIHQRQDIALTILNQLTSLASLKVRNNCGQTALHLAVVTNNPVLVRKIVTRGAEIEVFDKQGFTPLHLACKYGYGSIVLALTTAIDSSEIRTVPYHVPYRRIPQNQELRSYSGHTCLQLAIMSEHLNIAQHLVTKCFADINVVNWTNGDSLVHFCVQTHSLGTLRFLNTFRNLNLNVKRYDGTTPLEVAYSLNYHEFVAYLCEHLPQSTVLAARQKMLSCDQENLSQGQTTFNVEYDDICIGGFPV